MSDIIGFLGVVAFVGIALVAPRLVLIAFAIAGLISAAVILSHLAMERLVSPLPGGVQRVSYSCSCGCSGVVDATSRIVRCDNCLRIVSYEAWTPRSSREG